MSNYHFDEESLLELAKGIDDKGFKTTIKCNIGEDGFVESGSLDLLTKPGIYKLQICVLSDELKQMAQGENVDITGDIFGYCYVNVFTEDKITNFGQQTVIISEDLSKLKKLLSDTGNDEVISLHIKALPKLLYTRTIMWDGTNYTFSDWEEKTEEVEIGINLEAFSNFITGDEAAIEEAKKNIFIVPTDLNPDVYIAKVDITPFIYNLIPDYYTASIDSSGLSYNETPSGDGYYELTVEDVTLGGTPINEWRGIEDDGYFRVTMNAKLYRTGYNTDGSILEPKTLLTSIESNSFLAPGTNTIYTEYGDIIITCTSDGTKPSFELYIQTYGKLYLRWQLTVDENKIPESIIYNQTLDFTTSFNPVVAYAYCSLQDILLETLSGSGKILRTIENGVDSGWKSIDRIGVNVLKLIEAISPINIEYDNFNNLRISHAETAVSEKTLSSSSNGNFQSITAVGVDSWGHVDNITTTNYSVNPATSTQNGLMSSADKTYIESIKPVLMVESDKLSIGIELSDGSRKNAHEIHTDGKHYILGIGGYNGTNSQTAGVKTLQEVINGKQDILTAGTNISIEDDEMSATGYKFNTELQSFAELPDMLISSYMDMTSDMSTTVITFTGAAGSTAYNVGGEHAELLSNYVGMWAFKIGDGPIALLTSYDPESKTATFDKSLDENNDLSDTPFSKVYMYISIAFSGDANATTYSFVDMIGVAGDLIMEGGKIKIGNYPIATIVSVDVENSTITLDKTLDPDNAVSNAMFDYTILQNNIASGQSSHAEGENNTASGNASHAEGYGNTASGLYSHAEGYEDTASGDYSHTEGEYTTASGNASHAEGLSCIASGGFSHAEGLTTTASGNGSHAEGTGGTASGMYSHTEGKWCTSSREASHTEGIGCTASGEASHAEGSYTIANNKGEHSEGICNISFQDKTIHTVGIGELTKRKNAHEIHIDGKHYIHGIGGYDGTNSQTDGIKTLQEVVNSKQDKLTIEISWSDLKSKRDNGELIPGMQYRITDYVTTTIQADTQSAGHPFDVIVTALDTNKLSEIASAIQSTRDTDGYFSNSNLVAWQLWYCLDNDINRFSWADSTNGKGVIYRMIDEYDNDCPYDFKNIQFKRYKVTGVTSTKLTSDALNNLKSILVKDSNGGLYFATKDSYGNFVPSNTKGVSFEIDENDSNWYYTFQGISSADGSTINKMYDLTVETFKLTDECISYLEGDGSGADIEDYCRENKIEQFNQEYFADDIYYKGRQILNNIVFIGGLNYCYYNEEDFYWEYNTSSIYGNRFGVNCNSNTFGNDCQYNTFGNDCYYNIFGNSCGSNTFGNYCDHNTFGNDCQYNTFGNDCNSNIFGNNCYYNTFGNSCSYINVQKDYVYYIIVENGNQNINITSSQTTSSSEPLRNFTISQGVNNTTTTKTISHNTVGDTFKTTYQPANSSVVSI